jgi:hypothetical protein
MMQLFHHVIDFLHSHSQLLLLTYEYRDNQSMQFPKLHQGIKVNKPYVGFTGFGQPMA